MIYSKNSEIYNDIINDINDKKTETVYIQEIHSRVATMGELDNIKYWADKAIERDDETDLIIIKRMLLCFERKLCNIIKQK